mmetsp:Transcript_864/g.1503  ORF Transcript_864/g.1503 Transcript_864/m.1503 type:complete len:138 (+) Transcript_864:441-854(+)
MSTKDANKENEGAAAANANPSLNKNVVIYSTDMSEDLRQSIIQVAQRAFHAPVNHGKVYQTIADLIRTECEKECDGNVNVGGAGGGGGGATADGGVNESSGGAGNGSGGAAIGSGGWSCVVGGKRVLLPFVYTVTCL